MHERGIEISFGTIFKAAGYEDRLDVITDVGEGESFSSACLHVTENGERWFLQGGGGSRNNIEKIVGQLTLQEVIEALRLGIKQIDLPELPEGAEESLEKSSRANPRILK